jgi:hypothetical protein
LKQFTPLQAARMAEYCKLWPDEALTFCVNMLSGYSASADG